jgi:hypothetical protein
MLLLPVGMVVATEFVAVAITLTLPESATYAETPSGAIATAPGLVPTGMDATTVSVAVSMALTVPGPSLATYRVAPFGVTAKPSGLDPTVTVEINARVDVLTTLTSPLDLLILVVTYSVLPSGDTATA